MGRHGRQRNPFVDDEACESDDMDLTISTVDPGHTDDRPSPPEQPDEYDLTDPWIDDAPIEYDYDSSDTGASPSRTSGRRPTR